MKIHTQVVLHVIVSILSFFCFSMNMIGLFGASWIVIDESTIQFPDHKKFFGVIRTCHIMSDKASCYYRKDLFKFHYLTRNEGIILDVMFVTILLSTCCCFVVLQCTFLIFKCKQSEKYLKSGIIMSTVLSFLSVLLETSSVAYLQAQISNLPSAFEQGWTAKLTWATVCLQIVCTMLCVVLIIQTRSNELRRERPESPSSTLNYPLERYFYGSSKSNSMNRFNERWFDERYATTATNGYVVTGYTNNGYQVEKMRTDTLFA